MRLAARLIASYRGRAYTAQVETYRRVSFHRLSFRSLRAFNSATAFGRSASDSFPLDDGVQQPG